ncbi:MAG: UDP-3-O-(3-hydroxymyristoyl)glucosamine N-acyltransferase [Bacteroidia bacterium]|nr:UDP-3-O-(3-hydroxymyristoyl)glucosamine N-acyltransferase [Bacteroidia bacterium]HQU99623.1 LpxD N-terminal domain-containing protein [Bacteroidia bacterium]
MKLKQPLAITDAAKLINATIIGNTDLHITGINEIHMVQPGDLTFVDHPKYYDKALQSAATFVLINKEVTCPPGKALLFSDDPFRDYNFLTRHFSPFEFNQQNISSSAKIGSNCYIFPTAIIGNNVVIGNNCTIHAGVVIYDNCIIGNDVIIHANTTIGSDAFYYKKRATGYDKMHTCGRVVIDNMVEIGANCTIVKGVSGDTKIGAGTKTDCHVHVGHDTVIGKNCLFAAGVMIAGVTVIEDDVILWGQVGVQKDLVLAKGTVVLGQSGLGKNTEPGKQYFGSPAIDGREKMKELAWIKRIPEIWEMLQALKK